MKKFNRLYGLTPIVRIGMVAMLLAVASPSFAAENTGASDVIEYTATYDYGTLSAAETTGSDGNRYTVLDMPGLSDGDVAGAPDIPVQYLSFLVPTYSKDFRVSLLSCDMEETRDLGSEIIPVQQDRPMNSTDYEFTMPDQSAYSDRSDIAVSVLGEQFFEGWQHIVNVTVRPIAYDYPEGRIRCYSNLKIRLEYTPCQGSEMVSQPVFPPEPEYSPILAQLVVNPPSEPSDGPNKATAMTQAVKDRYLIVTTNDLKSSFEELAVWKMQKGYSAEVVTIESILSNPKYAINPADSIWDEAAALRQWLKDKYETSGHYFLLLAGDSKMGDIPIRKYHLSGYSSTAQNEYGDNVIPSDIYFVDFSSQANNLKKYPNGIYSTDVRTPINQTLPVGRLMCWDKKQVANYIQKLKIYEAWPGKGDTEYLSKGFIFTQYDGIYFNSSNLADTLKNYISFNRIQDRTDSVKFEYRRPTGAEVINGMKNVGLMSWQGHGAPGSVACSGLRGLDADWRFIQPTKYTQITGFSHPDPNNSLDLLNNHYYPSVAYSLSCTIMPFDPAYGYSDEYDIGTAFTVAGKFGGVALLGDTREGSWINTSRLEELFGGLLINNRKIGVAEKLSHEVPHSGIGNRYRYNHNLLGDPEFEIWLGKPTVRRFRISNKNASYTISGSDLAGCIISSYDGRYRLRSDKVMSNSTSVTINVNGPVSTEPQDRLISIWKTGCLPVMQLFADNVTLRNVTKTYSMPIVDLSASGSTPCKFNLAEGGTLKLLSATDICSDGAIAINGGSLILNGENVKITGSNKFNGGSLYVTADTVTFEGELEITGCVLELNTK